MLYRPQSSKDMQAKFQTKKFHMGDELPRPADVIDGLVSYDAVSSLDKIRGLPAGVTPLKLDWNESTITPSPQVVQAITQFLGNSQHLNWYPDLGATRLRKALTSYTGTPLESMLVTNGSDDALELICKTYLGKGDDAVVAWPSYAHFLVYAKSRGLEPRLVTPSDVFEVPTATLMREIRPDTQLVYITSPNNPTGVVIPTDDVEQLCRAFPRTLFVVDEAYYEFSGVTAVGLVKRYPNLIVTRTFSKCFGIAGLRIGYLVASDPVILQLKKLYNPKSVNALAQVAAQAALSDKQFREDYVDEVTRGKEILLQGLIERGAHARTGDANFILVKVLDPLKFVQSLESAAVYVRDRSNMPGFKGWVRITVGTVAQMEDLLTRIDELLKKNPRLLDH